MKKLPRNKCRSSPFTHPELRFAGENATHADALEALAGKEKIEMEGTLLAVDESGIHIVGGILLSFFFCLLIFPVPPILLPFLRLLSLFRSIFVLCFALSSSNLFLV